MDINNNLAMCFETNYPSSLLSSLKTFRVGILSTLPFQSFLRVSPLEKGIVLRVYFIRALRDGLLVASVCWG